MLDQNQNIRVSLWGAPAMVNCAFIRIFNDHNLVGLGPRINTVEYSIKKPPALNCIDVLIIACSEQKIKEMIEQVSNKIDNAGIVFLNLDESQILCPSNTDLLLRHFRGLPQPIIINLNSRSADVLEAVRKAAKASRKI